MKIINKIRLSLFGLCSLLVCSYSLATIAADKTITLVGNEGFKVNLTAKKPQFKVGEPIIFNVKGNQTFYMYLFAVNEADNSATLILPNKFQSGNKYLKSQWTRVPNKNVKFQSDRAGQEKLVMIASKSYFDWNTQGYTEAGKFLQTSNQKFKKQLKAFSLVANQNISEMSQQPVTASTTSDSSAYVKEFYVTIIDENSTQATTGITVTTDNSSESTMNSPLVGGEKVITFVTTNLPNVKVNQQLSVFFGADQKGWISLLVKQPSGKSTLLLQQQVKADQFYTKTIKADNEVGKHLIQLYFSKNKPSQKNAKAFVLVSEQQNIANAFVDFSVIK